VRLYPFANAFRPAHRLVLELSCNEPWPAPATRSCHRRPCTCHRVATSHKVYCDAAHHSRLMLPFTIRKASDSG